VLETLKFVVFLLCLGIWYSGINL